MCVASEAGEVDWWSEYFLLFSFLCEKLMKMSSKIFSTHQKTKGNGNYADIVDMVSNEKKKVIRMKTWKGGKNFYVWWKWASNEVFLMFFLTEEIRCGMNLELCRSLDRGEEILFGMWYFSDVKNRENKGI